MLVIHVCASDLCACVLVICVCVLETEERVVDLLDESVHCHYVFSHRSFVCRQVGLAVCQAFTTRWAQRHPGHHRRATCPVSLT